MIKPRSYLLTKKDFSCLSSEAPRRMLHASCNKRSIFHRVLKGPFSREVARFSLSPRGRERALSHATGFRFSLHTSRNFPSVEYVARGAVPAVEYIHVKIKNVCQCAPSAKPKPLSINRTRYPPRNQSRKRLTISKRRFTFHQNLSSSLH